MLKLEDFFMIRDIAHEVELKKGWKNISEISRRSGYNRRTVRKYLDLESIPVSKKRGI